MPVISCRSDSGVGLIPVRVLVLALPLTTCVIFTEVPRSFEPDFRHRKFEMMMRIVLISYCCLDKLLQMSQFKTTQADYLTVLEIKRLTWVSLG